MIFFSGFGRCTESRNFLLIHNTYCKQLPAWSVPKQSNRNWSNPYPSNSIYPWLHMEPYLLRVLRTLCKWSVVSSSYGKHILISINYDCYQCIFSRFLYIQIFIFKVPTPCFSNVPVYENNRSSIPWHPSSFYFVNKLWFTFIITSFLAYDLLHNSYVFPKISCFGLCLCNFSLPNGFLRAGTRTSIIKCLSETDGSVVEDEYCSAESRPVSQNLPCNTQDCPAR